MKKKQKKKESLVKPILIFVGIFILIALVIGLNRIRFNFVSFKNQKLAELKQILWNHNFTNYQGNIMEFQDKVQFNAVAWMNGTDKVAAFNSTRFMLDLSGAGFMGPIHTSKSPDHTSCTAQLDLTIQKPSTTPIAVERDDH